MKNNIYIFRCPKEELENIRKKAIEKFKPYPHILTNHATANTLFGIWKAKTSKNIEDKFIPLPYSIFEDLLNTEDNLEFLEKANKILNGEILYI